MSVFQKILEARRQIGAISKKQKQGIPYQFQGIEEVTHAFKQVFDEVGLLFLPANVSIDLVGNSWVLGYKMTFVDPEDNSEWSSHWGATIPVEEYRKNGPSLIDEKATGKAHSYAVKYFLMKTFMVTDKEDAAHDRDGIQNRPAETAQQLTKKLDGAKQSQPAPVATPSEPLNKRNKKLSLEIIKVSDELWGKKEASHNRHITVSHLTLTRTENINELTDEEAVLYLQMLRADSLGRQVFSNWIGEDRANAVGEHSAGRTSNLYKMEIEEVNSLLSAISAYAQELAEIE